MAFHIYAAVIDDGQLQACQEYATQDLARWWAINWLKAGYLPLKRPEAKSGEALEAYVPAARVRWVIITDHEI